MGTTSSFETTGNFFCFTHFHVGSDQSNYNTIVPGWLRFWDPENSGSIWNKRQKTHPKYTCIPSWWFQPIWKIWSSNWIISPSKGENNKYLKPPPRKRHNLNKYTCIQYCIQVGLRKPYKKMGSFGHPLTRNHLQGEPLAVINRGVITPSIRVFNSIYSS